MEDRGLEVQGHPWLCSKFEGSLGPKKENSCDLLSAKDILDLSPKAGSMAGEKKVINWTSNEKLSLRCVKQ